MKQDLGLWWHTFHILTSEDIDGFSDIMFKQFDYGHPDTASGSRWGDSHAEQMGMLVGNFEFNP